MTDTRRRFLARSATILAGTAVAGCIGGGGNGTPTDAGADGSSGDDGASDGGPASDTDTPPSGTATDASPTESSTATAATGPAGSRPATPMDGFTEWFPAPSALSFVNDAGYAFMSAAPKALVALGDSLGEGAVEPFEREVPNPGIETLGDATTIHQFARSAVVYEADFDRAAVEREFEDLAFSQAGTHGGFTVFTAGDTRAGAVGDDAIVNVGRFGSSDDVEKRPAVEAIIDAKKGDADGYRDVDANCDRLVGSLGNAHVVQGRTHEAGATFDGAVGEGVATHVQETETRVRASVVFDEESVDAGAVSDWASGASVFYDQEAATRTDGRVVTAAAPVPTGEVTTFPSDFPGPDVESEPSGRVPQVQFEFEYEETGDGQGLLAVTHYGGDAVAKSALYVRGSGFADVPDADQTQPGQWQGTANGDGPTVTAGDGVVLGVASDFDVQIVWQESDGNGEATLAENRGPGA